MGNSDTTPTPNASAANSTIQFTVQEQVIAYSALYSMALLCIICGSFRSLTFIKKHIAKKELLEVSINTREAKKFPITASCVLFLLYLIFKTNEGGVDFLLTKTKPFLSQISPTAFERTEQFVTTYIKPYTSSLSENGTESNRTVFLQKIANYHSYLEKGISYLPEANKKNLIFLFLLLLCWEVGDRWPRRNIPYLLSLKRGTKSSSEMKETQLEKASLKESEYLIYSEFDTHLTVSFLICSLVGISYLNRRHWITNNLLGVAFSIYGIENLHLASFKAGTILLSGLFIYDVFWVFATDVMTTVAKGIDAPILLIFPQDLLRNGWLEASKHGMLGLGDIVIPGIFVALLYRFDHYVGSPKRNPKDTTPLKNRYYCWITIVAYAAGLLITMSVMHYFKTAQPALLYLVPTCLFTPLFVALIRGEFKALWNYSEEQFVEKHDKSGKSEATKEKKNK